MGQSVELRASDSRHEGPRRSNRGLKKGMRRLRPDAITSSMLHKRYYALYIETQSKDPGPTAFQVSLAFAKQHPQLDLTALGRPATGLVPLLAAARQGVSEDIQHLSFDYFSPHRRAWSLLERLQSDLHEELAFAERAFGSPFPGAHPFLSDEPKALRAVATYLTGVPERAQRAREPNNPFTKVLQRAIAIIDTLATEESSVEVAKFKGRMSADDVELLPEHVSVHPRAEDEESKTEPQEDDIASLPSSTLK